METMYNSYDPPEQPATLSVLRIDYNAIRVITLLWPHTCTSMLTMRAAKCVLMVPCYFHALM